ncbi:MAG TPA: hypothetical protein VLI05_01575 [Candidatus Saccharimonadia bacterium]|nr:hypothetical protein [Candidatus Saccharimonadia bacterium]
MRANVFEPAFTRSMQALATVSDSELERLSLFDCAFSLTALSRAPELAKVRQRLAQRLDQQLELAWIERGDLGEVFAVLAALWQYDAAHVTGEHLAGAVQRLICCEAAVGGPYRANGTVPVAANAQIAWFMRLVATPLPQVDAFLAKAIDSGCLKQSKQAEAGLVYLLARASDNPVLVEHVARYWQQRDWQTPQGQAVAVTLLKGAVPASRRQQALAAICQRQHASGFWAAELLLATAGAGSRFATTALIVEALAHFRHGTVEVAQTSLQHRHDAVAQAAWQLFDVYTEPLRSSALLVAGRICGADENLEITLLPYLFAQALETPASLTGSQYTILGLANLCGWMAYTLYDDFLDHEGASVYLPIANIAMRASLDCFRIVLPDHTKFHRYVNKTFAGIDEANTWEVSHCRFVVQHERVTIMKLPRYGRRAVLAARSFGHALGPMAVLAQGSSSSAKVHCIEVGFRHYLIARQLNDDLRDWLEDIRAGQASYVVTAILRDLHIKPGGYDLETLLPLMRRGFRRGTMPKVCRCILRHIQLSRRAFGKSQLLRSPNEIYRLLDDLEWSVQQSLDKRSKGQAFIGRMSKFDWNQL